MNCSICKDTMLCPRIYPQCGHTICEPCMIKNDDAEKEKMTSSFIIPTFSCPMCRQTTIVQWYLRPINILILQELRKDKNYEKLYTDYKKNCKTIQQSDIPTDIDLSTITINKRKKKAEMLYKELLPIIFRAAINGQPFITITDKKKVKDIQLTADLLSKKLFNNKIYRLIITLNECNIDIIPSDRNYKSEYINPLISPLPRSSRYLSSLGADSLLSRTTRLSGNPHV